MWTPKMWLMAQMVSQETWRSKIGRLESKVYGKYILNGLTGVTVKTWVFVPHVQFTSVPSPSHIRLFATPWTAVNQASLSITNSRSLLKLMSIESVMPSNHLILCIPFSSCLQSFPAPGSFHMSQFFASSGQSIGVSASTSVLPMNTQDWFPIGWTGWISLQSKGLSRVFSNTTAQKHQFFGT